MNGYHIASYIPGVTQKTTSTIKTTLISTREVIMANDKPLQMPLNKYLTSGQRLSTPAQHQTLRGEHETTEDLAS